MDEYVTNWRWRKYIKQKKPVPPKTKKKNLFSRPIFTPSVAQKVLVSSFSKEKVSAFAAIKKRRVGITSNGTTVIERNKKINNEKSYTFW